MHDLSFADSARPARVVCLNRVLKPYSLGHELLMWRMRNPLLIESRQTFNSLHVPKQIEWLGWAVLACSRDWTGNQIPPRKIKFFRWYEPEPNWALAIAEFRNYLVDGRSLMPTLSASVTEDAEAYEVGNGGEKLDESGRSLGSPLLAQLLQYISTLNINHFGYQVVWDFPLALAANLYFTQLENEGRVHIENLKESQARAEISQHRKDIESEKTAARKAWESCKTDDERRQAVKTHSRIVDLFLEADQFVEQPKIDA